ncbi:hypothetical protein EFB08_03535 [Rufibacter latericius]|uniref:VCBS repeat-containing protein n=2 Tax=Rufibacter latericius TaxID=2487040 RepID=A0A3M9N1E5_9BACT|nr:hypothetical protein EFB08_03535 [Rufibacter latericius]
MLCIALALTGCCPKPLLFKTPTLDQLPNVLLPAFEQNDLETEYTLNPNLNPFYLSGNFDGDGSTDYAVFLQSKRSQKPAIAFVLGAVPTNPILMGEGEWPALKAFNKIAFWKATSHFPAGAGTVLPGIKGGGIVLELNQPDEVRWIFWDGRNWQCVNPE